MRNHEHPGRKWLVIFLAGSALAGWARPALAAGADPRDDTSPWGIASGAEWSGDYPRFNTVKPIDPTVKIGMSVANFDVGFLDAVIKAGAADHFDYICVHPYENLGAVAEGGEVGYLSLAGNLRQMLAADKQSKQIPFWITEIGDMAPIKAEPNEFLVKEVRVAKAASPAR